MEKNKIYEGNSLEILNKFSNESIDCVVTSPPYYGLRDYGMAGQFGLEESPEEYIENLVRLFREIHRVLKSEGTVWLNLGDSYWCKRSKNGQEWTQIGSKNGKHSLRAGGKDHPIYKPKDLMGMPWRVALALQADGWYLRSDIIWHKPNVIPESVSDRPTKCHEYIFLLSKSERYFYDHEAIKEESIYREIDSIRGSDGAFGPEQSRIRESKGKGEFTGKHGSDAFRKIVERKNKRDVWKVTTKPYKGAHFATYPIDLIEPCILAGCPEDGVVLDPFMGSGTTGAAALMHRRNYIGIELNPEYIEIAEQRINGTQVSLFG
ncbi:site-specific DNA-methyltransferase [Enterococcus sp. K18_3]|uniref:DNA-methyltransferase n=1 Tax=Enterococcus sp. K18_3 TaxID=2718932 RepID=UPI001C8CF157|nr:site-specific DNA-methyltransferase [Enterococcus sp. K18_3]MBX9123696.1 site-specific DNA-methyltransferase [Enterococcus sp. K18_3]